jgi:hypothetical protein
MRYKEIYYKILLPLFLPPQQQGNHPVLKTLGGLPHQWEGKQYDIYTQRMVFYTSNR